MKGCGTQGISNYIGLISGNNYETKAGATEETKFLMSYKIFKKCLI